MGCLCSSAPFCHDLGRSIIDRPWFLLQLPSSHFVVASLDTPADRTTSVATMTTVGFRSASAMRTASGIRPRPVPLPDEPSLPILSPPASLPSQRIPTVLVIAPHEAQEDDQINS